MRGLPLRARAIYGRMVGLGWPIAVQQTLTTLMRTVDILVTGLFSPAAVAAIGLADLYAQVPLRMGLGLGVGAIALSSQDTGRGADLGRDRAITQALLIGALCGVPLVAVGLLFSHDLIAVLGAERAVVELGGTYCSWCSPPRRCVSWGSSAPGRSWEPATRGRRCSSTGARTRSTSS